MRTNLLNTIEAAKLAELHPATLRALQSIEGAGPPVTQKEDSVYYQQTELEKWLQSAAVEHLRQLAQDSRTAI